MTAEAALGGDPEVRAPSAARSSEPRLVEPRSDALVVSGDLRVTVSSFERPQETDLARGAPHPADVPRAVDRAGPPPARQPSDDSHLRGQAAWRPTASNGAPLQLPAVDEGGALGLERGATAPQLRRFIKSRAYVPIHELRRRFAIIGDDDDVTPIDIDRTRVFVGLPDREGRLLGELLRGGDIGYELSMDPITPIVVGVYPMRPVTRN